MRALSTAKKGAIAVWLVLPAVALAYHYGPGQTRLQLDETQGYLAVARRHVEAGEHADAVKAYDSALAALPGNREQEAHRIRIERAKSQLLAENLPAAYDDLHELVPLLQESSDADPELLKDARDTQANTKYYLTWLMRLEGKSREEWEPEIESSRQTYRLLAEQAEARGDKKAAARHKEDLEAAIRLARLDLSDLQALPIPSQCQGCKSGQCNCKGKGKKPGNGKGRTDQPKTGDKFARGASSGPPPDGGGN